MPRTELSYFAISLLVSQGSVPPFTRPQRRSYRSYHRLWGPRPTTAVRQEVALTAVLPLEFNSLMFGFRSYVGSF